MNKTEAKFLAEVIQPQVDSGRVIQWWYEAWSFKLTEKTPSGKPGIRYTPDFVVLMDNGFIIVFEVKGVGNAQVASLNRTKLFAEQYPFRVFVAAQKRVKDGGGFSVEEY